MQRYRLIMNNANYDCYLFRKRLRFSELEATCQKSKGFYQYSLILTLKLHRVDVFFIPLQRKL
jgi:hypothetical protein